MKYPPYCIITGNQPSHILKAHCHLLNKYWPDEERDFRILGFHEPDFELPPNFKFISMGRMFNRGDDPSQHNGASNWACYLSSYFGSIDDEFVFFALDDYIPTDYLDREIFEELYSIMKSDKDYVQINTGIWPSYRDSWNSTIQKHQNYDIYYQSDCAPYTLGCSSGVRRTKYLTKYLERAVEDGKKSPWEFEIFSPATCGDGSKRLGTMRKWCFPHVCGGALSNKYHPFINILGIRPLDLQELLDKKLLEVGPNSPHGLKGYRFGYMPDTVLYTEGQSNRWGETFHDFSMDHLEEFLITYKGDDDLECDAIRRVNKNIYKK
jgi:hypothetical protein